jgi:NitT/TauT family transport system substrate-binding protein
MFNLKRFLALLAASLAALGAAEITPAIAGAEVSEVRIAKQYGLGYLPLIVMEERRLVEKHAKAAGLGNITVNWTIFSGGGAVNDALLSGSVDYISSGVAPLVVIWAKTNGKVKGVAALDSTPLYLNTNNPAVKSIKDFTEKDRIALPTVKVSIQAIILQMAASKVFGPENYAKLDYLTVSMKHPDAMAALLSGRSEITAHLTSPPFMFLELNDKRVHTVLNSFDVVGGPHTFNLLSTTTAFYDANPKTYAAVFAALEEAISFIRKNKRGAVDLYIKSTKTKESVDDLLGQLNHPSLSYTTTPRNIVKFSDFMYQTGTIKVKPKGWKDIFFPNVYGKKGS